MISQKIDELSSKVFDLSVRLTPGVCPTDSVSTRGDAASGLLARGDVAESEFCDMNVIKSKKTRKPKVVEEPSLPEPEPEPEPEPKPKAKRAPTAPKRKAPLPNPETIDFLTA